LFICKSGPIHRISKNISVILHGSRFVVIFDTIIAIIRITRLLLVLRFLQPHLLCLLLFFIHFFIFHSYFFFFGLLNLFDFFIQLPRHFLNSRVFFDFLLLFSKWSNKVINLLSELFWNFRFILVLPPIILLLLFSGLRLRYSLIFGFFLNSCVDLVKLVNSSLVIFSQ
jgi:hypothetical protein